MFQTLALKEREIVGFGRNEKGKIIVMNTIKMFVIFSFGIIHS